MARQNTTKISTTWVTDTQNLAGGNAFAYSKELELVLRCTSNFMEDTFYASNNQIATAIRNLVNEIGAKDPVYVMKLAGWLRNEMNMRSVSIYLLALMAGHPAWKGKAKPWLIEYGPYIMIRADEPAEALAAFESAYPGEKTPQALLKAISARLNKFSAYEAIKYRGQSRNWSLKDVIRVAHPKPATAAQGYLFNWVVNEEATVESAKEAGLNQLASYLSITKANSLDEVDMNTLDGATWELLVSKFGSKPEVWQAAAKVMPPFAYIRNLRNLLEKSQTELDYDKIAKAGRGKRILPFRFLTARNVVEGLNLQFSTQAQKAKTALDEAIELSVANVPNFGNVAVLVDYSGSMGSRVSSKSEMTCSDAARIFAAAVYKKADNAMIVEYDTSAHIVNGVQKTDRLFTIVDRMRRPSGGTNLAVAVEQILPHVKNIDLVYILTDEQSYMRGAYGTASETFKKLMSLKPSLKIVNHNLASYGTSELPEDSRILAMGGWSDQIFNVVDAWRTGGMVQTIRNWVPDVRDED